MIATGNITKMKPDYSGETVQYKLALGDSEIDMNSLIGKVVRITFLNRINCVVCGVKIRSTYAGRAMCKHCYETAPQAEECLFYPEKCKAHLGEARDMEWSKKQCLIPHYVYLSISSGLKVGVTRHHQIPVRWIDQGAVRAIKLAETPNRHIAGVIEVFLKKHIADKTSWKKMLRSQSSDFDIDLFTEKERVAELLPGALKQYITDDNKILEINYPLRPAPENPKTFNLEKEVEIKDVIAGIKGQYLLFKNGYVMNLNRYSGFFIEMEYPG
jgi:hypothetical protein